MLKINYKNSFRMAFISASLGIGFIFIPWNKIDNFTIGDFQIDIESYANLGTFVGGISAPFLSFSAFVLLYMTFMSQKKELEETREIFTKQSKTVEKQQFETTFFNLINLHNETVNKLRIVDYDVISGLTGTEERIIERKGTEYFDALFRKFTSFCGGVAKKTSQKFDVNDTYQEFYKLHQNNLSRYFNNLSQVLIFLEDSSIENKDFYAAIIKAQLSKYEILFINYHIKINAIQSLKTHILKYNFLDSLDTEELVEDYL